MRGQGTFDNGVPDLDVDRPVRLVPAPDPVGPVAKGARQVAARFFLSYHKDE